MKLNEKCPHCGAEGTKGRSFCANCGAQLAPIPGTATTGSHWRVNLLSLVGATIALIAIFSAWIGARVFIWTEDLNLIDVLNNTDSQLLIFGGLVFIIGAVVAFLSPIGGILELTGSLAFLVWFTDAAGGRMPSHVGPYLGLISGIIALVSMIKPMGFGYGTMPARIKGRLLVFSSR